MDHTPPLEPELYRRILEHLDLGADPPSPAALAGLVAAYTRRVPWESASRIARRLDTPRTGDCPRWPAEFWDAAITRGCGGTCFESNYAFYALLRSLGYQGYLTVNDMGAQRGCHTAIMLHLEGGRWLADVGIPLYTPLPVDEGSPAQMDSPFHRYTLTPLHNGAFLVERDRHPSPYIFTLIDVPVSDRDYRRFTTADYGVGGYFLDRVVINKIIGGRAWRFNSGEQPLRLEEYWQGGRRDHPLGGDVARQVAVHFGIDEDILRRALAGTGSKVNS